MRQSRLIFVAIICNILPKVQGTVIFNPDHECYQRIQSYLMSIIAALRRRKPPLSHWLALKEPYMNNLRCNRRNSNYIDYQLQRSAINPIPIL